MTTRHFPRFFSHRAFLGTILAIQLGALTAATWAQAPLGTDFTYQGQLKQFGAPASGPFDFEFKLFDDPSLGSQVGPTVSEDDLGVLDGLFTARLDFGSGVFSGFSLWLEVGVRPGASTGAYTILQPRQPVTAAPYGLYCPDAGTAANAANCDLLDGLDGADFLQISGGTIAGSLDATGTIGAAAFELNGETITSWPVSSPWSDVLSPSAVAKSTHPIWYLGSVGIGIGPPSSRLHVADSISTNGGSAVRVDFDTPTNQITTIGVDIESATLGLKGVQRGLRARASIDAINHPQVGSTEGNVATVSGFDAGGSFIGVSGLTDAEELDNFDGTTTSRGLGGLFHGRSPAGGSPLNLDATGTYWVGGVMGRVSGMINNTPAAGAVAAVIGIDETTPDPTGTPATSWAGYFEGDVKVDGDLTVTGACNGCGSDLRLKRDIAPLDGALGRISALRGVRYQWQEGVDEARDYPGDQIGVIAQDVEAVFPELVGTDSDGYRFVRYQKLVVPLIEAVKELAAVNAQLREIVCLDHPESDVCQ